VRLASLRYSPPGNQGAQSERHRAMSGVSSRLGSLKGRADPLVFHGGTSRSRAPTNTLTDRKTMPERSIVSWFRPPPPHLALEDPPPPSRTARAAPKRAASKAGVSL